MLALTTDNSPAGLNATFAVKLFVQREGHIHEQQADPGGQEEPLHFFGLFFGFLGDSKKMQAVETRKIWTFHEMFAWFRQPSWERIQGEMKAIRDF